MTEPRSTDTSNSYLLFRSLTPSQLPTSRTVTTRIAGIACEFINLPRMQRNHRITKGATFVKGSHMHWLTRSRLNHWKIFRIPLLTRCFHASFSGAKWTNLLHLPEPWSRVLWMVALKAKGPFSAACIAQRQYCDCQFYSPPIPSMGNEDTHIGITLRSEILTLIMASLLFFSLLLLLQHSNFVWRMQWKTYLQLELLLINKGGIKNESD